MCPTLGVVSRLRPGGRQSPIAEYTHHAPLVIVCNEDAPAARLQRALQESKGRLPCSIPQFEKTIPKFSHSFTNS